VFVFVVIGCDRSDRSVAPAPAPSATGGGPFSRASARDRIAERRCTHLASCSAIAKGKTYDTLDSCRVHEAAKVDDDLHDDRCDTVDAARLDTCERAVVAKKCDAFFTTWPDACERAALCAK
jgi:hypothetical protein